ncbi:MAG: insulinase family protein [Acidobacteria bacterium]|nr:insulinase family protein [Acidobacteriota bacterium]
MKKTASLSALALLATFTLRAGEFRLPPPEVFTLDNGMTVLYRLDRTAPLVSFQAILGGAGTADEPQGKEGVAGLTADLLLKGCGGKSAQAVAEAIDFMGASLTMSSDAESAQMSGLCLREHFPVLLDLASAALTTPDLPADEFERERARRRESFKSLKDDAHAAIRPYFMKAYFAGHPLGRLALGTEASLGALGPDDVKAFYKACYRPDRMILCVVGDISPDDLKAALGRTLGTWARPAAPAGAPSLPEFPKPSGRRLLLVDKPDLNQSFFILGGPGFAFGDPVEPRAQVFNTLFGDRFTSWLNTELRIKRGLTYGAGSAFQGWRNGGLFTIASYTKNEDLGTMLDITLDLMKKAREQGFAAADVESARNYIRGQTPLDLETAGQQADAYAQLRFYGIGWDYFDRFLAEVSRVTPAAVADAAKRLVPSEDFTLVVLGKAEAVLPILEKYGKFEVRKISDPGF